MGVTRGVEQVYFDYYVVVESRCFLHRDSVPTIILLLGGLLLNQLSFGTPFLSCRYHYCTAE